MLELKNIKQGKYDLNNNLFFNIDGQDYKISAKDALEIAYTLFDSMNKSYDILEEIDQELEK